MEDMTSADKKELYAEIAKVNSALIRVLAYLENDDKTNHVGLVEQVNYNKKQIDMLKMEKNILYGKAAVFGGIGAFLIAILGWLINFITSNLIQR